MNSWEKQLETNIAEVLFDEAALSQRVREIAQQINADYQALDIDELVVVGVLRGSVVFMSDLIRQLQLPLTIDFIAISSYAKGTHTSGMVRILKDIGAPITDKHVLVIEDIVDSGLTMQHLFALLQARAPRSLKLCTLLDKPSRRQVDITPDYRGFEIPDVFVVGYGLDFADQYRQLPYIGTLKPEAYQ